MKFVSKMSNHRIILRPGLQGNPMTGSEPVATLYVQFRDGMASVQDEELIEKMLKHRGLNKDFIKVEEGEIDPYKATRASSEPVHVMSDIENGRVVNRTAPPASAANSANSANVSKMIEDRAREIALAIVAEMAEKGKEDSAPAADTETPETPEEPTEVLETETADEEVAEAATPAPKKPAAKKTTKK